MERTNNKISKRGRKRIIATPDIRLGSFTAEGIQLEEASIDKLVARITLQDCVENKNFKQKKVVLRRRRKFDLNKKLILSRRLRHNRERGNPSLAEATKNNKIRNLRQKVVQNKTIETVRGKSERSNEDNSKIFRRGIQRTRKILRMDEETGNIPEIVTNPSNIQINKENPKSLRVYVAKKSNYNFKNNYKSPMSNNLKHQMKENLCKIIKPTESATNGVRSKETKLQNYYFLKFQPNPISSVTLESKLILDFMTLLSSMQTIKLPSNSWKIRVTLRHEEFFSVVFSNGQVFERSITFFAKSAFYNVVIDNVAVLLIGCPKSLDCVQDIEKLLDIVHNINISDPMIKFK